MDRAGEIPLLWNEFNKARQPDVLLEPDTAYGVVVSGNRDHFDYFFRVRFLPGSQLPETSSALELPARRYAVFGHESHGSELRTTTGRIFGDWLPALGFAIEGTAQLLRRASICVPLS
jgi:predicted transcriptional regulator YdeE